MSTANPTHSGPAQHCSPASPPLRASASPRETPSAPIRVIRGSLLCLLSVLALPQVAPAQEDVAETKTNLTIDTRPIVEAPITAADREHWSFAPIKRQPLPATKNQAWPRTPVDPFILAKQEAKNLSPAPEADRATLLRRLSFDLTGLPPTPAELTRFESDTSPDAYERQIDRLLAAPTFGERWGQYWLDLARFAESDGYEFDTVRPHAWTYRDWVIAALNADLPYNEFIRQQLAGDRLSVPAEQRFAGLDERLRKLAAATPAADPKAKSGKPKAPLPAYEQVATIFTLAGPDMPDVNDQAERRHDRLNELTGAVGSALLGLQIGCAQCHDHKYDPISQADFYRLRAVFEPALPSFKRDIPFNVLADQQEATPARFWIRGDHRRPGAEVPPAFPRIASTPTRSVSKNDIPTRSVSEGHEAPSALRSPRSALADWLTSPNNPLTSRVIANRLWLHHFGRGLCETPSDFGVMSGPLSHPELLDWLAAELQGANWSLKQLHRLIVNSATYRQSAMNSEFSIHNSEFYTHFPRRRLEGEAIRDAMLAAAGLLTTERGGPGVMPPLPEELVGTLLKGQWTASKREADHYKRSVYVFARRNLRYPLFEAFDRPDANASCALRSRSTTAPQSLLLFNSELSLLAAQHLAGRILAGEERQISRAKFIDQLYQITLARRPTSDEAATLEKFLVTQRDRLTKESRPREKLALPIPCPLAIDANSAAPLVDACLAIINSNEFIYVE